MDAPVDSSPAAGGATGRVPDFFIVGHAKSGTSALYQMLREHPQLHMPRKEPSFFVPELLALRKYPRGLEDYMALFADAGPGQLVGEATTWYLWSQAAAQRIAQARPEARIVAVLREPASFLHSLHQQFLRSDVETEPDLRRAMELEGPRSEGRQLPRNSTRPQLLRYSEHVRYVEQLRRYHDAFGHDQVLVLIYEDFRADNAGTVRRVLRFLGVDDTVPVDAVEANTTVGVRGTGVNSFVRSLSMGSSPAAGAVKAAIKAVSSQRLRRATMGGLRRRQLDLPADRDEELMRELRVRFRGEVEALSGYLDRDLVAFWRYGDLGA